jgi:hypothetical protein
MWIGPGGTGSNTELTLYIRLTGCGLRTTALFFLKNGGVRLRENTMYDAVKFASAAIVRKLRRGRIRPGMKPSQLSPNTTSKAT